MITETQDQPQVNLPPNPLRDVIYSVTELIEEYAALLSEDEHESPDIVEGEWELKSKMSDNH